MVSRREFLEKGSSMLAMAAAPTLFGRSAKAAPSPRNSRPNIILIMADDMGYSDIGCYGSEIQTPHLDALAQNGARFTQFYNCARCMPSRASLLTGLWPHQAGIGQMGGPKDYGPAYQGFLNDNCVTLAEALKLAGYTTLMTGKWHVGSKRPYERGFQRFWGVNGGEANYFRPSVTKKNNQPTWLLDDYRRVENADGYFTDMISDHAVSYIDQYANPEKPFFMYVAYTAPHWPLHAYPEDIARYRDTYKAGWDKLREQRYERMKQMGIIDPRWPLTPREGMAASWDATGFKEWQAERMAVYAAQVDRMDQGIGRIVAKLREKGILDNTLVMFLSDNGACSEDLPDNKPTVMPGPANTFASYGLAWANLSNTPFRLYKHWVHEGGIATPFIAHWPGVVRPGAMIHQPGHIIDIMATCLDLAEADYPTTYLGSPIIPTEGQSLAPALRGEPVPDRVLYWEHEGNRAVRQGPWKLVSRFKGGSANAVQQVDVGKIDEEWHLYNMTDDRTEMRNLAAEHPEKVRELAQLYENWAARIGVKPWRRWHPGASW